MSTTTTLVVGATGNTGKHVVQFLLNQNQNVKVICRSADKMKGLISLPKGSDHQLDITEAAILDLSDDKLKAIASDCDTVVSCLGHNMNMKGIWGRSDKRLVRDSVRKLTKNMPSTSKFILMGSDGVSAPGDKKRSFMERTILFLLRHLMNPHVDNEEASAHVLKMQNPEWCIVRPTDLQDGDATPYTIYDKPPGGLFGSGITTRATVAKFMVDLTLEHDKWSKYKLHCPVVHDQEKNM